MEQNKEKLSKTRLREEIFKIYFAAQFARLDMEELENFFEENNILNKEDQEYIKKFLDLKYENEKYLRDTIEKYLKKDWEYSRVGRMKKAALELSILEIKEGTPFKVVINEIVKILKLYEDEKAAKFVNGILASYIKDNNFN